MSGGVSRCWSTRQYFNVGLVETSLWPVHARQARIHKSQQGTLETPGALNAQDIDVAFEVPAKPIALLA